VIRVLIADEIARILGDLEKLEPYRDDVDVCGVAHQASAVIEEAWLRQPDVLLLHERFADLPPSDFAAHLASVSPATRVLLMTASATSSRPFAAPPGPSLPESPASSIRRCRAKAVQPPARHDARSGLRWAEPP
jgi:hypothetical protein